MSTARRWGKASGGWQIEWGRQKRAIQVECSEFIINARSELDSVVEPELRARNAAAIIQHSQTWDLLA